MAAKDSWQGKKGSYDGGMYALANVNFELRMRTLTISQVNQRAVTFENQSLAYSLLWRKLGAKFTYATTCFGTICRHGRRTSLFARIEKALP